MPTTSTQGQWSYDTKSESLKNELKSLFSISHNTFKILKSFNNGIVHPKKKTLSCGPTHPRVVSNLSSVERKRRCKNDSFSQFTFTQWEKKNDQTE